MPFPKIARVIYAKNPLDKVICQLRFPPILKVDTEIPAGFQDRLRSEYPNLSESIEVIFDLKVGGQQRIPSEEFKQLSSTPEIKHYEFSSENNQWKIELTRNSLALSTSAYVKWEEFRGRFKSATDMFVDIYKPLVFSRVGLRYIDIIVRSKLNLEKDDWNTLIQPYLLGVIAVKELEDEVRHYDSTFEIGLEDEESRARIITRIVKKADSGEPCYMIDSDFFNMGKIKHEEVINKLDFLNVRAGRLFRWCITEKLHSSMEPKKI